MTVPYTYYIFSAPLKGEKPTRRFRQFLGHPTWYSKKKPARYPPEGPGPPPGRQNAL